VTVIPMVKQHTSLYQTKGAIIVFTRVWFSPLSSTVFVPYALQCVKSNLPTSQIHETLGPNAKINFWWQYLCIVLNCQYNQPFQSLQNGRIPSSCIKGKSPKPATNTMHTQDLVHYYKYQCIRYFQNGTQNFDANYFPKSKKIEITRFLTTYKAIMKNMPQK